MPRPLPGSSKGSDRSISQPAPFSYLYRHAAPYSAGASCQRVRAPGGPTETGSPLRSTVARRIWNMPTGEISATAT
jgi:hypothetical protein